jgi:hypothetical protein
MKNVDLRPYANREIAARWIVEIARSTFIKFTLAGAELLT